MPQEIVITYETLFDLLQRERERAELQKLEPTFFSDTLSYIRDKKKILEAKADSVFAADEKKKTERQLENIYKILKELYERREKKIINIALDKSRTKSNLVDTSALLKEEKVFFDSIASLFDSYRDSILMSVLNDRLPFMNPMEHKKPQQALNSNASPRERPKNPTKLVRFTSAVQKFVGPELEEYGPFKEEDIASLPNDIAQVLITKSKAEEINEDE